MKRLMAINRIMGKEDLNEIEWKKDEVGIEVKRKVGKGRPYLNHGGRFPFCVNN
jgi:hypothetical protein